MLTLKQQGDIYDLLCQGFSLEKRIPLATLALYLKEKGISTDMQMIAAMKTYALLEDLHLTYEDLLAILKEANYDIEVIREKYNLFKIVSAELIDPKSWLIDALTI